MTAPESPYPGPEFDPGTLKGSESGPRVAGDHDSAPLGRHEGRVHISARHRRIDAATIGRLALHIPNALCSLLIVTAVSLVLGELTALSPWVWIGLWLLSGSLAFWRPAENLIARLFMGMHHPTDGELARLTPLWQEVTARAGVDASVYTLWVEESYDINAAATGGHIVSVTSHAVERLPDGQLAAVLAHELGHHVGGHAWSALLTYWYSLPGRLSWHLLRVVIVRARERSRVTAELIILTLVACAVFAAVITNGLILLLAAAPFLISAVGRNAELRADRYASGLGLAPQLTALLSGPLATEPPGTTDDRTDSSSAFLARLLASHPDSRARLHAIRRHTEGQS